MSVSESCGVVDDPLLEMPSRGERASEFPIFAMFGLDGLSRAGHDGLSADGEPPVCRRS